MSGLRIAYVINSVEGGGAASPVPSLASVLQEQGAQVRVFALTRRDGRALPPIQQAGLDPLVRKGGETDHRAAASWLRHEIREWGATHIWTSLSRATLLGLVIGPKLGLPVICWQHAAFLKPWNQRLLRLLQSRALLWVGDSRSVTELTRQRLGVTDNRLMTWPIYFADPAMPQARPWQTGQPIRLGSLGRLHRVKGYDILIGALARLKAQGFTPPAPLEIELAGDGAERERLLALAAAAGMDNLALPGFTDDPRGFLAGLHLYLQPSRSEGFCIAAHEAMTAGLPIIASAVGELPHSITPGHTGDIAAPGDVDGLAASLGRMLAQPQALHAMGQNARAAVLERYSQNHFTQAGAAICRRIRQATV